MKVKTLYIWDLLGTLCCFSRGGRLLSSLLVVKKFEERVFSLYACFCKIGLEWHELGFRVKGLCLLLVCLVFVLPCFLVAAAPTVSLSFYKNNGYGLGGDMSGQWTVNTAVSPDVVYVEFYLDDQLQFNDTSAPFSWQFATENYPLGNHTIEAVAFDASGENATAQVQRNFVDVPTTYVLGIVIAVVVVVLVIAVLVSVYRIRKTKRKTMN